MDDPIVADVHARIRQAFLLGLARQPLATPPSLVPIMNSLGPERAPELALLALAGQRQRFVQVPQPAIEALNDAARRLHEDPRPILPPQARRALARLARSAEKSLGPSIVQIAVRRIGAARCRVHPFDLPELAHLIRADVESLGLAERAYLAMTTSGDDGDRNQYATSLFYDRITADNWTTFPKAQRRAFVAAMRRDDPAAGRGLVQTVWKTEPAPMRAALLEAFATGLGPDDRPFLTSLATDRADSVKQAAASLLTRMPSAEGSAQRLAAAAQCFVRPSKSAVTTLMKSIGLGDGTNLTFALPSATANATQPVREQMFTGLSLDALAEAVGATPDEILGALPAEETQIVILLIDTALQNGDTAMARRIVGARLTSIPVLASHHVIQLADRMRLELEPDAARRLLATPAFADTIRTLAEITTQSALKDDGRLVFAATLMPCEVMPAFIQTLAPLSPSLSRPARDFADLVLALPARSQS